MRCRGINQRREVVIEFKRTFMVYKRDAPEVQDSFPVPTTTGRCDDERLHERLGGVRDER